VANVVSKSSAPVVTFLCLTGLFHERYIPFVAWSVEYTDEFENWWETLDEDEQESVTSCVLLLEARGPMLGYPFTSGIEQSKHSHMRELRIQHSGRPYRVLYAFDPRRVAILLIGGDKTADNRWYDKYVPLADRIYDQHIEALNEESK
jgi:hypothetical protein